MKQAKKQLNPTKINLAVDSGIFIGFLIAGAPHFTGMAIHEMKILGRIVIILIAALAVIGITTALMGSNSAGSSETETESRPIVQDQPGVASTDSPDVRPPDEGPEGERNMPNLFGVIGIIQNLVIISLIVGVVTLGSHLKGVGQSLRGRHRVIKIRPHPNPLPQERGLLTFSPRPLWERGRG